MKIIRQLTFMIITECKKNILKIALIFKKKLTLPKLLNIY